MAKKLLLLDCDGVIFDSNRLIDEQVQKIYYCASDKYCTYLNDLAARLQNEIDQLNMERPNDSELKKSKEREKEAVKELISDHFYAKDMVLEEVLPEYKNRIDYFKIYQKENLYPGVLEKLYEIIGMGIFDDMYIVSHYNSENERRAKETFFEAYLPGVKVLLMKFHKEPFIYGAENKKENKKRERTNKILEFRDLTGEEDFSMTSFVDDSLSIIEEAEKKVKHCFYKDKVTNTIFFLDKAVEFAIYDNDNSKGDEGRGK